MINAASHVKLSIREAILSVPGAQAHESRRQPSLQRVATTGKRVNGRHSYRTSA